jgi:2-polyprenyl-6-methoxyphenol hydroxylase-like FAD-dependent oxidoreductase
MRKAVVLGGGLAGMLAAAAITGGVDQVVIVERDRFPDSPGPRRGLPQSYHSHILMRGGAEALDRLIPGLTDSLYAAGARRRGLPYQALARGPQGWMERLHTSAYVLLCTRDLLDHVVRGKVLADPKIVLRQSTRALGLVGTAARVTGVRIEQEPGQESVLDADLVIDATGRHCAGPGWLAAMGLPEVRTDVVDAGIVYASRWYDAPPGTRDDFPGVMIQLHSTAGEPGRGAGLLPMEDNRWILSIFGSRGGEPSNDEDEFAAFARSLYHPLIAELIAQARPAGPIRMYRGIPDQWRRFEKLAMPAGLIVIGDAVTALNPAHGTGMSLAAQSAEFLRTELGRTGLRPDLARRAQAGIAAINGAAWRVAIATDQGLPGLRSTIKLHGGGSADRVAARVARTGCGNRHVMDTVFSVATLCAPASAMMRPSFLRAVIRGPRSPLLTSEQAIAQFPEFGDLLRPVSDAAPQ